MSIVKFLLPLALALATCWARDPILDEVQPVVFDNIPLGYRLPNSGVTPVNYEIELTPYFEVAPTGKEPFSFDGKVKITLERNKEKSGTIKLHAKNLQFPNDIVVLYCELLNNKVRNITGKITQVEDDAQKEFITLDFEEDFPLPDIAKKFYFTLTYTGTLKNEDDLRGFYRSYYKTKDGVQEWLATTQFEPVSARRAFPCWDEPAMKATFDIIINHPSDYKAISNMKEKPKEQFENFEIQADGLNTTRFEKTPKMSTYLVAFAVSKFEKISNKDESFNVWVKPDAIDSAEYALDNGIDILSELESYTNIKYYNSKDGDTMGMQKMDQISIPQFAAGAMENWGLVTYRESSLLVTENITTTSQIQDIRTTISHEFAHQWFGNLVTPEWWTYIWLNEGFATFFQYFTVDSVQQNKDELSWRLMEQFVVQTLQGSAFVTDAGPDTHPMNQDAATPEQIQALFNNIAYKKAASVIRMMQHILTDKIFTNGLKKYLKDNMYQSVTSDKLFEAMLSAAKEDKNTPKLPSAIDTIMRPWVNQSGYPVVTVERNKDNGDATLKQQRFFLSGPSKEDKTKWYIPINYITEKDPNITDTIATDWLEIGKDELKIKKLDPKNWIIINNFQTGYYRVNYDKANWERLATYLQTEDYVKITPVTRAQLIDDSLNLARAGYLSYESALPITLYLTKEIDYIPMYTVFRAFDFLDRKLHGMSNYEDFQKYVAQRLKNFASTMDLTDTPKNTTHLFQLGRGLAVTESCRYGLKECKEYTLKRVQKWLEDREELPTDLRDGILCAGIRQADQQMWNKTLDIYKNTTDINEKNAIYNALGCVQNTEVIQTFLKLSLEDEPVIDLWNTMKTIAKNNLGSFDILIDFIDDNIDAIKNKDNSQLNTVFTLLAAQVTDLTQYGKMMLVAKRVNLVGSFYSTEGGKENLDWLEQHQEVISKWVKENYKSGSPTSITVSFLMVIPLLITRFY